MGSSCCFASADERKADSAQLKIGAAVSFTQLDTPRSAKTDRSIDISDHATDLNTDRALKEILDDGTEVPVAEEVRQMKESKSQNLTLTEFKPTEDQPEPQESSKAD